MSEYYVNPNPGYVSPASNVAPSAVSPMTNVAPLANVAPVTNVAPMVNLPPIAPAAVAPTMVSPAYVHPRPYWGPDAILVLFILLVIILRFCF